MDLKKLRDMIKAIPLAELRARAAAIREINRVKELCRCKGEAEVNPRSLRIKILKRTENTNLLLSLIKKAGLEGCLEKGENESERGSTKTRRV
jgi:hypothetical protein